MTYINIDDPVQWSPGVATVLKQQLPREEWGQFIFSLELPEGSRPLHVAAQHGVPCLWYECDMSRSTRQYDFAIIGTGQGGIPPDAQYIGTYMLREGNYVAHLFMRKEE